MSPEATIVTGGSGFIGSALCDYLLQKNPETLIINVSKHTYATSPKTVRFLETYDNYKFFPLDICDTIHFYEILKKYKVSKIFHLAAETHVDRSFMYPQDFLWSNVQGTFSILEAVRALDKKPKVYYMGTDEVFGDVKEGYKHEDDALHPENPYVASKAACECYCHTWYYSFQVPVVIGRSMNVFGPRQHPEKLIAKIITHCLSDTPYTLYKGNSLRGWTYVYDTAEAVDIIMNKGKLGEIYHIPPITFKTVNEVNETILKLTGKGELFKGYVGERHKDDYRYALDTTKMKHELNWQPKIGWEEAIEKTVEWYKENRRLWDD